ncbi:MAG: hypothetical protein ACQEQL_08280 [Pseudomonadota bacterium]
MAKDKKKKNKANADGNEKTGISMLSILRAVILPLLVAVVFLPSTIVLSVLMLPTLVAAVMDANKPKALSLTIGALNLAGASTAWFELLRQGHRIAIAQEIAMDPQNVFIAYGAAFVGWFLYMNVTALVAKVISRRAAMRIRSIDKRQNELKDIWGPAVATKPGKRAVAQENDQSEE